MDVHFKDEFLGGGGRNQGGKGGKEDREQLEEEPRSAFISSTRSSVEFCQRSYYMKDFDFFWFTGVVDLFECRTESIVE